jgi:Spy/CpxP family protein refolding chaperone
MEVRKHMRRKITMLIMAAMLALTMSVGGAGAAFAANNGFTTQNPGQQDKGCGGNNPNCATLNRGGNAPAGQQ